MSVYQTISHRPWLRHINKCSVNGTIAMRMIFTHRIADDTCTFSMWFIRTVIQFYHGKQNTSLYRLHTISYIRKRTCCDYTHRIINIRCFHRLFQINFMNPVSGNTIIKYIITYPVFFSITVFIIIFSHFFPLCRAFS